MLVYISGPMTATATKSIEQHTAAGVDAFLRIMKHGVPAFCPHLCGGYPSAWTALPHSEWIEYDMVIIDRCTHVVLIGDWERSPGAMREFEYAASKGIPVINGIERLFGVLGIAHG